MRNEILLQINLHLYEVIVINIKMYEYFSYFTNRIRFRQIALSKTRLVGR